MIDPMAGLDDGPMKTEENAKEVFDSMTLQRNFQRIDKIRSVMGIAAGCATGIVGLTGLEGFAFFLVVHFAISLIIWALKMNFNLKGYVKFTWWEYLMGGLQQYALSFTLFWTLFYGLVYLY
ncbi:Rab5-interacting protein (Rab5ip) [Seminavis robusta]|uniref:ER membrane protein complex subunit 6 n=1 Tax=Seminavis robusta TaxID=568900 RepID=A0A9N8ETZ1_9STRA|nr:Rab5-interacting protein (Rab5ip) [Seminavis robusta]|eukprot:Sro1756_g295640.1 Rab5-interacting protein (Rab5ip) (122) ;mRNA; r:16642-17150